MNFEYLTSVLENYGFVPVPYDELQKINLTQSIGSFEYLFNNMQSGIKSGAIDKNSIGMAYKMTREEKDISFLNNYFIYKKVRNVSIEDIRNVVEATTDEKELEKLKESLKEEIPSEQPEPKISTIKFKRKTTSKK